MNTAILPHTDFWVEIRENELGRGVYARVMIPHGIVLGPIEGAIRCDPDYSSEYAMDLGWGYTLNPEAPFRFLNHSCEPNCELFGWDADEPPGELYVGLIQEVEAGAQLTIDYSWPLEEAVRCRCRSSNCRGWIVDEALLDKNPLAPWVDVAELD